MPIGKWIKRGAGAAMAAVGAATGNIGLAGQGVATALSPSAESKAKAESAPTAARTTVSPLPPSPEPPVFYPSAVPRAENRRIRKAQPPYF